MGNRTRSYSRYTESREEASRALEQLEEEQGPTQYEINRAEGFARADFSQEVYTEEQLPVPETSKNLLPPPEQDARIGEAGSSDTLDPYDGSLEPFENAGLQNKKLKEKLPAYNASDSETVTSGQNNTHIILGRDRWGGPETGYGGLGHTRAGAIDIVVGLQGWSPGEAGRTGERGQWIPGRADKNFGSLNRDVSPGDAARIYISQRADIDDYFDICDGFVGRSYSDSAIAMKADSIRVIARKGIKLVTQKNPPGRNSINGKIGTVYGIDLIAGNRDFKTGLEGLTLGNPEFPGGREINYLQPIPKGDNLQEYLSKLHDNVQLINSILAGLIRITWSIAENTITPDTVISAIPGVTVPTPVDFVNYFEYVLLSLKQWFKLWTTRQEMLAYKIDYLEPVGALYINSRHNRTN